MEGSNQSPIDDGVQPICDWLNAVPGVVTHFSCEGHPGQGDTGGYVAFTVENQESLHCVLSNLPQIGGIGEWELNGHPLQLYCRVDVGLLQGQVAYDYRFSVVPTKYLPALRREIVNILYNRQEGINLDVLFADILG